MPQEIHLVVTGISSVTQSATTARTTVMHSQIRRRPWDVFIIPAMILMTLTVFWGVQDLPFLILEDDLVTEASSHATAEFTSESIVWAFVGFDDSGWHPMPRLSLILDLQLYGNTDAGWFHLTDLFLHLATVLLLFAALRQLTGKPWPSALVAALFAIHPQSVEPVVWIAERKSLLAAFFGMGSVWAWTHYIHSHTRKWHVAAVILFACSLLSGHTFIALPLLLLLPVPNNLPESTSSIDRKSSKRNSDLNDQRPTLSHRYHAKAGFFACSILVGAIAFFARPEGMDFSEWPFSDRVAEAFTGGVTGLAQTIRPQAPDGVSSPNAGAPSTLNVLGAVLLLMSVTTAVTAFRRQAPWLERGWFWYLATLIPAMLIDPNPVSHVTDTDMYVPQVGLFFAITWSLFSLAAAVRLGRFVLPAITVPVCAACLASGFLRVNRWQNNDAIFADPPVSVRLNDRAHYGRSAELLARDPPASDQAVGHLQEALQLNPNSAVSHARLGKTYLDLNQLDEAGNHLRAALDIRPDLLDAHWNLALVYLNLEQPDAAEDHFLEVAGHPKYPQVHEYLSLAREYQSPRWRQLRRIRDLGGRYELAGQDPRSPVVTLSLTGTTATDTDLAEWKQFTRLESLELNGTQVTDDGLRLLHTMTRLHTLGLNSTRVTNNGLAHLKKLKNLRTLTVGLTHVDGRGVIHLKELPQLSSLAIAGGQVTDEGIELLQKLQTLRRLNLSHTRISDKALEFVSQLSSLESLDLVNTAITDTGLLHLKELSSLRALNLFGTRVTGHGLRHLIHADNLRRLALDETQVDDTGLKHIGTLRQLEMLTLTNTHISDDGLRSLQPLTRLRQLNLGGNPVSDASLEHLKVLKGLQLLDLSFTQVTGRGIDRLSESMPRVAITW